MSEDWTLPRDKEIVFLQRLSDHRGSCSRSELPCITYEENRARQLCRKRGWAFYISGRWHITAAGCSALSQTIPATAPEGETEEVGR